MRCFVSFLAFTISIYSAAQAPAIDAKSAILMDERSGAILWQKDAHAIRYPASTTKILTAILLLEHTEPDELVTAPLDTETVEGASLHLKPGETITAADLLKALLLRSANDACHALAVHVSGSDLGFAKLMNQKAKDLGCLRSHFMAPHGLHNDKHYTTAYDLALIAREAMKLPEIRDIVCTRKATIARSMNTQDILLISKNKWLEHDPSADGIKTGYTKVARATFVGSATRNGMRFISVLLKSETWEEDQKALINFGFKNFIRSVAFLKGGPVGEIPVSNGDRASVRAVIDTDIPYGHAKGILPKLSVELKPKEGLSVPISIGAEVGTATFKDEKGWRVTQPVFAGEAVNLAPSTVAARYLFGLGVLGLGGASIAMRRKSRSWATNFAKKS